jgi:Cohesin domain
MKIVSSTTLNQQNKLTMSLLQLFRTRWDTSIRFVVVFSILLLATLLLPLSAWAATLSVTPPSGVYTTGSTFTVNVIVNTAGKPINAADGTLSFNPRELSVVSASRGASIFNLWTAEPTFSNSAGTVTFGGGLPSGYTGASGNVMTVTFRSLTSGSARVSLTGASVLAADGRGTNVLTAMNGGTYTLSAASTQPAEEVIVEYVPPANTPGTPSVTSTTHPDEAKWSTAKTAELRWSLPLGVVAVRTLVNESPVSIPTKVYDEPLRSITIPDLDEGVSYFHIQFKNAEGWGKVAHYRLAVDSAKPTSFTLSLPEGADLTKSKQVVEALVVDETSAVLRFKIQINGNEAYEYIRPSATATIPLSDLKPGQQSIVVEAFDEAGNSVVSTYSFTISSFDKPIITEYPSELSVGVSAVIRGTTRPNSLVTVALSTPALLTNTGTTNSDAEGNFTFVSSEPLQVGLYQVTATAIDSEGAQSEASETVVISVREPGYLVVGTFLINVLSVIIPLIALCVLTWMVLVYSLNRLRTLRRKVLIESDEAVLVLRKQFSDVNVVLDIEEQSLMSSRKTQKLTEAEAHLITTMRATLAEAESKVAKEIEDVTKVITKK